MISKELLQEVTDNREINIISRDNNIISYSLYATLARGVREFEINIYELAHKNLKEWAKIKNVFDKINWSDEPDIIFKKAKELNEIDKRFGHS